MLEVAPVSWEAGACARVEFASDLGASSQSLNFLDTLVAAMLRLHELPQLLEGDPVSSARGHGEELAVGLEQIPPPFGSANLLSHTYLEIQELRLERGKILCKIHFMSD